MLRHRYLSGTKLEPLVGYSRAIRVGDVIHVSGTTATDQHGNLVGDGDAAAQTERIIKNIRTALENLGGDLASVVRTRIYATSIDGWEAIGRMYGEHFESIQPATSMVEVHRLIDPNMLVEIEAEAVLMACRIN